MLVFVAGGPSGALACGGGGGGGGYKCYKSCHCPRSKESLNFSNE